MPSRETFAYRRALKLRAQKAVDDNDSTIDSVFARAQDDFLTFCTIMDSSSAPHAGVAQAFNYWCKQQIPS